MTYINELVGEGDFGMTSGKGPVYAPGRNALDVTPFLEGLRMSILHIPLHNVPGEGLVNMSRLSWGLASLQDNVRSEMTVDR